MLPFDRDFVRYWSSRYLDEELSDREQVLFDQVGPAAARRGYLTFAELTEIGQWKTRRATSYLARNDADDPALVPDVTRIAFAPETPDRLRHRILCLLHGVGHPMASAILTIWRPNDYTVLDYRLFEVNRDGVTGGYGA